LGFAQHTSRHNPSAFQVHLERLLDQSIRENIRKSRDLVTLDQGLIGEDCVERAAVCFWGKYANSVSGLGLNPGVSITADSRYFRIGVIIGIDSAPARGLQLTLLLAVVDPALCWPLAAIAPTHFLSPYPSRREGGIIVPYVSMWESLADAVERVVTARGVSRKQAQADLCHVISDGEIRLRGHLDRHAQRGQTSRVVVSSHQLEIPTNLEPGGFDWQESRPTAPWFLRELERHHFGPWYLKRIELSRDDVTAILVQGNGAAAAIRPAPRSRERAKSKRVIAENAIREVWFEGPPPREKVSNCDLVDRVSKHMKRAGASTVSPDTILRAAGRK